MTAAAVATVHRGFENGDILLQKVVGEFRQRDTFPGREGGEGGLDIGEVHWQTTPAMALGIAKHVWSIGELLDAALAVAPPGPTETAPDRRRRFLVIEGGRRD